VKDGDVTEKKSTIIDRVSKAASSVAGNVSYQSEKAYQDISNKAAEKIDNASAAFEKAYEGVSGVLSVFRDVGIVVLLISAPVPTAVGVALLWMMKSKLESTAGAIDKDLERKSCKREFDSVVGLLKKYGKVPGTAIVETEHLKMTIDSVSGRVEGKVKTGSQKGKELSAIGIVELEELKNYSPDEDTKKLIEAYASYVDKAENKTDR